MRKKYDCVIFDCDGTLVDSEPLTNRLIAKMINEQGIHISPEECLELFAGKTIMHVTDYIKPHVPDLNATEFEEEYRDRCLKIFNDELEAIPGVTDLLDQLTVPFCVASNGPKRKMDVTLPAAGLSKYFTVENTFSAYDISKWKPEPALFLHASRSMGIDPEKCVVIEDTWSGAMAAINANIDVFVYNPHKDNRVYLNGVPNFNTIDSLKNTLFQYL